MSSCRIPPQVCLVGTHHHHGHFEITGRQDVKHAIVLALLLAPVLANLFGSNFVDRRRFQQTATELASLHGTGHGANGRTLKSSTSEISFEPERVTGEGKPVVGGDS
jgi:hypothetical protein